MNDYRMPKQQWPPGPWDDEPDRVPWTDPATGYPCIIRRNPVGAWCGYVGVPPGHPYHGKGYNEIDYEEIDIHGGLTYAAGCDDDPANGICHIPPPGQPDDVWWFGFDCAHAGDITPGTLRYYRSPIADDVYRDLDYVAAETTRLAAQLHQLR